MKLKHKLSLVSSVFLVLMVVLITSVVAFSVYRNAQKDIEGFRQEEFARVKEELSDKVSMVYEMINSEYNLITDKATVEARYGNRVKNVVEVAMALLQNYQSRVDSGEMSLSEAQAKAKQEISQIRYDENVGYLWINDTSVPFAKMIMHPTVSSLDGKVLDDPKWNTAMGRDENLFSAAVSVVRSAGHGFVDYQWPKPTKEGGLTEMQPKISYVSLFEPWGWVVGTGIYVDDARTDGIARIKNQVAQLRYDNGEGYFFITDNTLPHPKMVLHPISPELDGKVLDDPKWHNIAFEGTEDLFTGVVRTTQNANGAGFVDYIWSKPTSNGLSEPLPKLTYAREFKPLNWVIGSGVYTDNIDKIIAEKEASTNAQVQNLILVILAIALGVLLLSLIASYLFAASLSKGLEELTEIARDISLGKSLNKEIESTERKDEIGQLARAIERLQTSVNMMMMRMKKGK